MTGKRAIEFIKQFNLLFYFTAMLGTMCILFSATAHCAKAAIYELNIECARPVDDEISQAFEAGFNQNIVEINTHNGGVMN